jgi:hypothetical protein
MQGVCALLSCMACPALPYVLTLPHTRYGFRKYNLFNIKCVLIFPTTLPATLIILRRMKGNMTTICIGLYIAKVPIILVRF